MKKHSVGGLVGGQHWAAAGQVRSGADVCARLGRLAGAGQGMAGRGQQRPGLPRTMYHLLQQFCTASCIPRPTWSRVPTRSTSALYSRVCCSRLKMRDAKRTYLRVHCGFRVPGIRCGFRCGCRCRCRCERRREHRWWCRRRARAQQESGAAVRAKGSCVHLPPLPLPLSSLAHTSLPCLPPQPRMHARRKFTPPPPLAHTHTHRHPLAHTSPSAPPLPPPFPRPIGFKPSATTHSMPAPKTEAEGVRPWRDMGVRGGGGGGRARAHLESVSPRHSDGCSMHSATATLQLSARPYWKMSV